MDMRELKPFIPNAKPGCTCVCTMKKIAGGIVWNRYRLKSCQLEVMLNFEAVLKRLPSTIPYIFCSKVTQQNNFFFLEF
jgi:hypothetical protein